MINCPDFTYLVRSGQFINLEAIETPRASRFLACSSFIEQMFDDVGRMKHNPRERRCCMNPTVIAAIIAAAASLGGPVLSCFLSRKAEVRAQKAEERAEAAEKRAAAAEQRAADTAKNQHMEDFLSFYTPYVKACEELLSINKRLGNYILEQLKDVYHWETLSPEEQKRPNPKIHDRGTTINTLWRHRDQLLSKADKLRDKGLIKFGKASKEIRELRSASDFVGCMLPHLYDPDTSEEKEDDEARLELKRYWNLESGQLGARADDLFEFARAALRDTETRLLFD